jgi:ABC-type multidrug transport system ATPase subunit
MAKTPNELVKIEIKDASKKYINEWVFKNVDLTLHNSTYAIVGPNGSGKSTFLQCLSGLVPISKGNITYSSNGEAIPADDIFNSISIVSPALELIEEFTLHEVFEFHKNFRKLQFNNSLDFAEAIFLPKNLHKQLKNFSSGMKQRVKLGLAFFSESKIILFDEPTTNLDESGCNWYADECQKIIPNKLIIIASNQKHEYEFCDALINMLDFK